MGGQAIAGSQAKYDLSHLVRIARLVAPVRREHPGYGSHGRFIIWDQARSFLARTSAPVGPHSARFERTYLDAKGCHLLGQGLGEAPDGLALPVTNHTLDTEPSLAPPSVIDVILLIVSPLLRCRFLLQCQVSHDWI